MKLIWTSIVLAAAFVAVTPAAWAQSYATGFEPPDYLGSPGGVLLSGQQGWYLPAGSIDYSVYTYAGNAYGFAANPTGNTQFIAGLSGGGTNLARAQRDFDWSANTVWTVSWDVAAQFVGALPATDYLGSFSLQPSTTAKYWQALNAWNDPNSATQWHSYYVTVENPVPGVSPGAAWNNLAPNHWYRQSTTFNITTGQILSVTIKDLVTNAESTVTPANWHMLNPAGPLPTALRVFSGGSSAGNVMAWDNLNVAPPATSLYAYGLPHTPLGAAQLALDPNGNLVVSNIGSSGQDGVTTTFGDAGLHSHWLRVGDPNNLPAGAFVENAVYGIVNGVPNQLIGRIRHQKNGDHFDVSADFSAVGATAYRVDFYSGSVLVGTQNAASQGGSTQLYSAYHQPDPNNPSDPNNALFDMEWPVGGSSEPNQPISDGIVTYDGRIYGEWRWLDAANVHVYGGSPSFTIAPQFGNITAGNINTLTFMDESLSIYGLDLFALGAAHFQASGGTLAVSNLGSSGNDGVSINAGSASRVEATLAPLGDPNSTPTGAYVESRAFGSIDGVPNQPIGQLRFTDIGAQLEVSFHAQAGETQRIQVYNGGTLVADVAGHIGPAAHVSTWPAEYIIVNGGKDDDKDKGAGTGGFSVPVSIGIIGGPTVLGDLLMISSEGPQHAYDIAHVDLVAANLPQFTLTNVMVFAKDTPFFGLPHDAIGNAQLAQVPDGDLTASNLGSSGQDGVRVRAGAPEFTTIDLPDVATMPNGASRAILSVGTVNGVADQPVGTITVSRAGAQWNVTPDFSPLGNVQFQYQIRNQGQFVGILPGSAGLSLSGPPLTFSGGHGPPALPLYDCGCGDHVPCKWRLPDGTYVWNDVRGADTWQWVSCDPPDHVLDWYVHLPPDVWISIGGPGLSGFVGDQIEIVLFNAPPIDALTTFDIRTLGTPALDISAEAVGLSGLPVQAEGSATLTAARPGGIPQIQVGNLGLSGLSGISVDLPPTSRAALTIAQLDPNSTPQGAYLECTSIGTVNGTPDQILSTLRGTQIGNQVQVQRAAQSGETQRIQVYLHDQLVADVPHHTGPAANLSTWPAEFVSIKEGRSGTSDEFSTTEAANVAIIGGPTVIGDRVMIQSELANDIAALSQARFVGAGLPGFTLTAIAIPAAPYLEPFEEYLTGSQMHGQGGWHGWDGNAAAGALVSSTQAHSAPNSVAIAAASDLVREFHAAEGGLWKFSAWQYVPGNFQSNCVGNLCGSYCLLLNTYQDQGPYNWSVELHADSITNSFIRDANSPASLPLIKDAWVEIKVVIDLDHDSYRVFYGGNELGTAGPWTQGIYGEGGGLLRLQALDLYANGSTPVYYDDISLAQVPQGIRGDLNCDGRVDFGDINPFVLALSDPAGYARQYPECDIMNGDINDDGRVDFGDINPFVALLSHQ